MKPTNNQKDLLFRISNFIKGFVLAENINDHNLKTTITKFVYELSREGVLDENDEIETIRSIHNLLLIIGDNDG